MSMSGSSYKTLWSAIETFELDTSHFKGKASFSGQVSNPNKRHWRDVLVLKRKEAVQGLRRALLESGREYLCEKCNQGPEWNGEELVLQVDHINGNTKDNRPDNVRFLCPNCHSQTPNWACKNTKKYKQKHGL